MLIQAEEKLAPDAVYIDVFLQRRMAALFADLSGLHRLGAAARGPVRRNRWLGEEDSNPR